MKKKNLLVRWLWFVCFALLAQGVAAQASFCDNFTSNVNHWTGSNASASHAIDNTSSNGTGYLLGKDENDVSFVYNSTDFIGAALPCGGTLCWRYKIFDDAEFNQHINVVPSIRIYSGPVDNPTLFATFKATGVTVNETSDWVSICASIGQAANGVLPAGWTMGNNGTVAQWNQLATSFTGVAFNTDINPNPIVGELIGIDNFCINPGPCCNPNASSLFSMKSECINGVWTVTVSAGAPVSPNNWWGLMETSQQGNTSDAATLNNGQPVQLITGTFTATFTGLDPNKFYYIKHGIWDPGCYNWRETRNAIERPKASYTIGFFGPGLLQFTNTLCYGYPINMLTLGSPPASSYNLSLWRRPINSAPNTPYTFYATLGNINGPVPMVLNLTNAFAGLANPVYFDPNFEYSVRLNITPEDKCFGNTEVQNTLTITCCDGFFNADFCVEALTGSLPDKYTLRIKNYETYSQIGAVHEWYVLSSPNQNGGPYTNVYSTTNSSPTFDLYTQTQYNLFYTVVHKLKTKCGEICMMKVIYESGGGRMSEAGTGTAKVIGCLATPIDCNWIDSIWNPCPVPTGLFGSCSRRVLVWNPVQGATGYTVEISYNDPACCRSSYAPVGMRYEVSGSSLPLWSITTPKYDCFRWRVMTRCANGATSAWSEWQCYYCPPGVEDGSTGGVLLRSMVKNSDVETKPLLSPIVSPNPNNGDMTLSLQAPGDLILSIDVVNAQGSRVTTIARNTYKGGQFNTKLSLGTVAKGVYTVVFNTNYGIFRKKVIVQ